MSPIKILIFTNMMLFILNVNAQSNVNAKIELIKRFYMALYNKHISPEDVVAKYVKYRDTAGYKEALATIMHFRNPADGNKGHFSLLKKDITEKNFSICNYSATSKEDKTKFDSLKEIDKNNIYKVKPKHTIPQYILIEKETIVSFFGFEKPGANYTFIVYQ